MAYTTKGSGVRKGKMIYLHYHLSTHTIENHEDIFLTVSQGK